MLILSSYLGGHGEQGGHPKGNSGWHWPAVQPEGDLQQSILLKRLLKFISTKPVKIYTSTCHRQTFSLNADLNKMFRRGLTQETMTSMQEGT